MFEDLWNTVVSGEIEKSFELVDFNVQFKCALDSTETLACESGPLELEQTGPEEELELSTELVALEGKLMARSDVYVSMKVSTSSPQLKAEAGWRAEFSADVDLTLLGESTLTWTQNLWKGQSKTFKFALGVVPVWLDVRPELDGKFSFETSSDNGVAKLSVGKC